MSFKWSDNARHIQSLYRHWQIEDGYTEKHVGTVELSLSIRLPLTLRSFYRSWGTRDDLTRANQYLLPPERLVFRSDVLVFCVENQAVFYWGIRNEELSQVDPPVVVAYREGSEPLQESRMTLRWAESHEHVSDFLDALTYHHAFCGGALHGAESFERPDERRIDIVKQHWQLIEIHAVPFGMSYDAYERRWPIYIRDAQALDWFTCFFVASRTEQDVDEIGEILDLTWERKW